MRRLKAFERCAILIADVPGKFVCNSRVAAVPTASGPLAFCCAHPSRHLAGEDRSEVPTQSDARSDPLPALLPRRKVTSLKLVIGLAPSETQLVRNCVDAPEQVSS